MTENRKISIKSVTLGNPRRELIKFKTCQTTHSPMKIFQNLSLVVSIKERDSAALSN